MATTIRQLIITYLKTLMATITVANGYETNVGSNVFEWREYPMTESEMPAVVIRDTDEDMTLVLPETFDCSLKIDFILFAAGATVPEDLRKIIGDITKALGVDESLGGYAYDMSPISNSMVQEHQENIIGDVLYTINVRYRMAKFDPYTLHYV